MTSPQRRILSVALLSQAVGVGLTHGIFPVFLEPLERAFEAPRTQVAAGSVLMMLALVASSLVTGMLFDRGHGRRVMLTGATLLALGLSLAASAGSLGVLAFAAVLMGASVPSIGPLSGATLVSRFFDSDRGRALGWVGMGPPLGAGLFAGVAGLLLARLDWRTTAMTFAVVDVCVLWPLIWFSVPARFEPRSVDPMTAVGGAGSSLRRPIYWLTAAMFAIAAGISTGWTAHFAAFLSGQGLARDECAALLSAQFWMAVPASFAFGALGDRIGPGRLLFGILSGQGAILLVFSLASGTALLTAPVLTVLAVASGLVSGGLIPLFLLALGRRVEGAAYSRAVALSNLLMLPVMAGAVMLAADGFERTGDYREALLLLAGGHLVAIGCLAASNRLEAST